MYGIVYKFFIKGLAYFISSMTHQDTAPAPRPPQRLCIQSRNARFSPRQRLRLPKEAARGPAPSASGQRLSEGRTGSVWERREPPTAVSRRSCSDPTLACPSRQSRNSLRTPLHRKGRRLLCDPSPRTPRPSPHTPRMAQDSHR